MFAAGARGLANWKVRWSLLDALELHIKIRDEDVEVRSMPGTGKANHREVRMPDEVATIVLNAATLVC